MNSLSQFFTTISNQHNKIIEATFQHLSISLYSLLIAVAIAVPLAIWATRHKKIAAGLLQITGVFQTIPSLALLGILIPLVGIGVVPTIIALVVYALLPIFQNSYVGLTEIDPALVEAADAFGLTRWKKLIKLEIPVALPMIISGIRTALVFIIGTATLAALIGAGGLGNFILLGINENNFNLIIIGAIGSALLAIILSGYIGFLQKRRPRVAIISLAVLVLIVGAINLGQGIAASNKSASAGSSEKVLSTQAVNITIAGKLGAEPDVMINMYKELIEQADPNAHVTVKSNFGNTTFLFNALKSDSVQIYPEYTGTVLETLVKEPDNLKGKQLNPQDTYTNAKDLVSQQFNMTYGEPAQFQDTYALAIKQSLADQDNIKTISDLQKIDSQLNAGFDAEFAQRADGYAGIQSQYGVTFKNVSTLDQSLAYTAINTGKVDVIDAYSTDSGLKRYGLVALEDNKDLFPSYQAAPLMNTSFANQYPFVLKALNELNGKISATDMEDMNYQVDVGQVPAETVAKNYLQQHGLLAK